MEGGGGGLGGGGGIPETVFITAPRRHDRKCVG